MRRLFFAYWVTLLLLPLSLGCSSTSSDPSPVQLADAGDAALEVNPEGGSDASPDVVTTDGAKDVVADVTDAKTDTLDAATDAPTDGPSDAPLDGSDSASVDASSGNSLNLSATGLGAYVGKNAKVVVQNRVTSGVVTTASVLVGTGGTFNILIAGAFPKDHFGIGLWIYIDTDGSGTCNGSDPSWNTLVTNDFSKSVIDFTFDPAKSDAVVCTAIPK